MSDPSSSNKLRELASLANPDAKGVLLVTPDEMRRINLEKQDAVDRIEELEARLTKKEDEVKRHTKELVRLTEKQKELNRSLEQKEVEVQNERTHLHSVFADREASLHKEFEIQQSVLKEREANFRLQREVLEERTKSLEVGHTTLQQQIVQRAIEHDKALADLLKQKEQYEADFQSRMEAKAAVFVDNALESLKSNERRFEIIGSAWSVAGLLAVLGGTALAYFLVQEGTANIVSNKDISWPLILFFGVKGVVLLGLIVAVVRLCSKLSRNYMHESVKNGERRHAINYGKFYLSVYGAGTDAEKLKDVFSQWNIEGNSAFSEKDESMPQSSISEIGELAKTLAGLRKAGKDDDKD